MRTRSVVIKPRERTDRSRQSNMLSSKSVPVFVVLSFIALGNAALASKAIDCVNGKRDPEALIWLGTIRYTTKNSRLYPCSGVAITTRHILTPAHCVIWKQQKNYIYRSGEFRTHNIMGIFIHPKYTLDRSDNDIAILKLGDGPVLSSCLSLAEEVEDVSLTARRFDVVTTALGPSGTKSHRTTKITSHAYCQRKFEGLTITELEVCAHIPTDSPALMGSALVGRNMENGTEAWKLLGISTHGLAESNPHMPTLFTLISAYRKWIEEIINL